MIRFKVFTEYLIFCWSGYFPTLNNVILRVSKKNDSLSYFFSGHVARAILRRVSKDILCFLHTCDEVMHVTHNSPLLSTIQYPISRYNCDVYTSVNTDSPWAKTEKK